MKLQELANNSQVKQITKIMESYFGDNFSFHRLTREQAMKMLSRVRSMIKEQRASSSLHTSEQNPAYLKLIMMEQALKAQAAQPAQKNQPYVQGQQQAQGPASPVYRGNVVQNVQDVRQATQGQTGTTTMLPGQAAGKIIPGGGATNAQQQQQQQNIPQSTVREAKKKRRIREASELQQAQVVLASQDMIDQIQGMLEDVSELQFKDLPALVDQAKAEVGPGNATQFQQAATQALTGLLQALQQGKAAMEGAQGALTGQAPVPIAGAEAGATPTGEVPAGEAPTTGEEEMPAPAEAEPEPAPSGRALGRGRR